MQNRSLWKPLAGIDVRAGDRSARIRVFEVTQRRGYLFRSAGSAALERASQCIDANPALDRNLLHLVE
jgi:hypothetical protein